MTGQINDLVSSMFNDNRLQTHQSCENRLLSKELSQYLARHYKCPDGATSVFFFVSGSTVLNRENETSLINPHYVSLIYSLVTHLLTKVPGFLPRDILIISYYDRGRSELARMLRNSGWFTISVRSVDSSQGSESAVVILSTTRPGVKLGLASLRDRKRCNVALSRAS